MVLKECLTRGVLVTGSQVYSEILSQKSLSKPTKFYSQDCFQTATISVCQKKGPKIIRYSKCTGYNSNSDTSKEALLNFYRCDSETVNQCQKHMSPSSEAVITTLRHCTFQGSDRIFWWLVEK